MINKNKFSIKDTKKVLHKVGKRWVVVSAVLLGLAAGGAAVTTANADTTAQAAQPTAAQQVNKNANMSAANHSFGAADPANATKAPSTMKLGAANGINGLVNSVKSDAQTKLANKNLPYTKSSAKAYVKDHAHYADVNHLTELASLANKNSAQSSYADLVNLANNSSSRLSNSITVGYDQANNSSANTLFGILDHAITDVNAINKQGSNAKLNKISSDLTDVKDLANNGQKSITLYASDIDKFSNVAKSLLHFNLPSFTQNVPNSGKSNVSVDLSSIATKLGVPASYSQYFNAVPLAASVAPTISVNPSFTINESIQSLVNSNTNVSQIISSAVNTMVSEASNSVSTDASSMSSAIDSQAFVDGTNLDNDINTDLTKAKDAALASALPTMQNAITAKVNSVKSSVAGMALSILTRSPFSMADPTASQIHSNDKNYINEVYKNISSINQQGPMSNANLTAAQDILNINPNSSKSFTNAARALKNSQLLINDAKRKQKLYDALSKMGPIAQDIMATKSTEYAKINNEIKTINSIVDHNTKITKAQSALDKLNKLSGSNSVISTIINKYISAKLSGETVKNPFNQSKNIASVASSDGINEQISNSASSIFNSTVNSFANVKVPNNTSADSSAMASAITATIDSKLNDGNSIVINSLANEPITSAGINNLENSLVMKIGGTFGESVLGLNSISNKANSYINDVSNILSELNVASNSNNSSHANVNDYNDLVSNAANLASDFKAPVEPKLYSAYSNIANDAKALLNDTTLKNDVSTHYNTISAYANSAIVSEANSSANSMSTVSASISSAISDVNSKINNYINNSTKASGYTSASDRAQADLKKAEMASAAYNNSLDNTASASASSASNDANSISLSANSKPVKPASASVTEYIYFTGDPASDYSINGIAGTSGIVNAPSSYHFTSGNATKASFKFSSNGTATFNVASNTVTETIHFIGDSNASTATSAVSGTYDQLGSVSAPSGYTFSNSSTEAYFNYATSNSSMNMNVYAKFASGSSNSNHSGNSNATSVIDTAFFNGYKNANGSTSSSAVSGSINTNATLSAPTNYHFISSAGYTLTSNASDATFNLGSSAHNIELYVASNKSSSTNNNSSSASSKSSSTNSSANSSNPNSANSASTSASIASAKASASAAAKSIANKNASIANSKASSSASTNASIASSEASSLASSKSAASSKAASEAAANSNNNNMPFIPSVPTFNNGSMANTTSASAEPNMVSGNSSNASAKSEATKYVEYAKINKALQLHTNPNFTKKNGVAVLEPNTRVQILHTVKARNGLTRYEVRYNHKNYYITANKKFVKTYKVAMAKNFNHYRYVKVDKTLQLHTSARFTRKNRAMTVQPKMEFHINHIVKNGKYVRYEVRYQGHNYFITANDNYVENAYLQKSNFRKHGYKAVRVTKKLSEYKKVNFKKQIRNFRKGAVLPVKRVITLNKGEMTRLQLTNGRYVSANKDFVKVIK